MYYTHPGCRTSILDENRAYCIRDFTVTVSEAPLIVRCFHVNSSLKYYIAMS